MFSNASAREALQDRLRSDDPSVRWRARVLGLGEARSSPAVERLERTVRRSPRVRALLAGATRPGTMEPARNPYAKWQGLHWALASIADLGYPSGDPGIRPLVDVCLRQWTGPTYRRTYDADDPRYDGPRYGVPRRQGRARRCASMQGNALRYGAALAPDSDLLPVLRDLLVGWQWPDGGWNCDPDPSADTSSFMETLLPLRGLAAHARVHGDRASRDAARRAAEVFLTRRMYRRRSNGTVIRPSFLRLHFPLYWHYDFLGGLSGLEAIDRLEDPRAGEAIDRLMEAQCADGGWRADERFYRVSKVVGSNAEFVDWGSRRRGGSNDWVTTEALGVLRAAGRFRP